MTNSVRLWYSTAHPQVYTRTRVSHEWRASRERATIIACEESLAVIIIGIGARKSLANDTFTARVTRTSCTNGNHIYQLHESDIPFSRFFFLLVSINFVCGSETKRGARAESINCKWLLPFLVLFLLTFFIC